MSRLKFAGLLIAVVLVLFTAAQVQAATDVYQKITIVDFAFQPASITVHLGDIVYWKNTGAVQHTSTSDKGYWDSGPINPGGTFGGKARKLGTYTYHCNIHPFMMGSITVVQ